MRSIGIALSLACALLPGWGHGMDICGCETHADSARHFHSADPGTWPDGTVQSGTSITIPVPEDGVLIFGSFTVDNTPQGQNAVVGFAPNEANDVVTLLVAGHLTVANSDTLHVNGFNGSSGSSGSNGVGGLAGPGGFPGGDGAYQLVNFAADGGAGLGPGGGNGATSDPQAPAGLGQFVGIPELLPMIGGNGGGGGRSDSDALGCSGGGGGGGGGLLAAVNGTATITGAIRADGGRAGGYGSFACASSGAPGSGGAVRLVANTITGTGAIYARGDTGFRNDQDGRIRLEAFNNDLAGNSTTPVASRTPAPGPLSNPLTATVAITTVDGETVSVANNALLAERPQAVFGLVDVVLTAPGTVEIDLATSGVPAGTNVDVTIKPSPGGLPFVETATLEPMHCDGAGNCTATVVADRNDDGAGLPAGHYVLEARATFQVP